jgi:type 1 glutamine amidotransferase
MEHRARRGLLVCGGRFHDFDFVRLRLLQILAVDESVRMTVVPDWSGIDSRLAHADFLVSYTCDVRPTEDQAQALSAWVRDGHRWLALHATNSALELGAEQVSAQPLPEAFVDVLGSRFLSHPPIAPFTVTSAEPDHPLVTGVDELVVTDELYLSELRPGIRPLLVTHWSGETPRFADSDWTDDQPRPVAYLNDYGAGCIYYLTLGHARGHYDMQPEMDHWPTVDRGPWEEPRFQVLVRRGLDWVSERSSSV